MEIILQPKMVRDTKEIEPDVIIDAIGLNCPAHVMKAKAKLIKMSQRQIARFESSDRSCAYMVEKLIRSLYGYKVMTQYKKDGRFVFMIRREM